jgi:hypothetical protein
MRLKKDELDARTDLGWFDDRATRNRFSRKSKPCSHHEGVPSESPVEYALCLPLHHSRLSVFTLSTDPYQTGHNALSAEPGAIPLYFWNHVGRLPCFAGIYRPLSRSFYGFSNVVLGHSSSSASLRSSNLKEMAADRAWRIPLSKCARHRRLEK